MKLSQLLHDVNPKLSFPYETIFEDYPHPFYKLEKFEVEIDEYDKEDIFNKIYSFHINIQRETEEALSKFQFEINLCPVSIRADYANNMVDRLLKTFRRINEKNSAKNSNKSMKYVEIQINKNYYPLYLFLLDALKNCFETILKKYESELYLESKKEILEIFTPKKPILSFELSREITDEDLRNSFQSRLVEKGLIHPGTQFITFKNLFQHRPLNEKIHWTGSQGALYYFIKQIVNKDKKGRGTAVVNPENKHWKIASEFFIYNGGKRVPNLKHQKPPSPKLKKYIDLFVDDLLSLT